MDAFLVTHEALIRAGAFGGLFVVFAILEAVWPRRQRAFARRQRWPTNLAIAALNTVVLRFAVPLLAVGAAAMAERLGWGLFNALDVPGPVALVTSLIILDLVIYGQHVAFHRFGLLWRLHRVHHSDRDFDVTTALRFHPIEIMLSMALKMAVVLALGVPVVAVILFEIVLNGMAMFNHANLDLPATVDRCLRVLVVTPDMHRVHHSVNAREHHRNFGFNLSIWDRLFASYKALPDAGHDKMTLGLAPFQGPAPNHLPFALTLPFKREPQGHR